jgi:hypothetical protein
VPIWSVWPFELQVFHGNAIMFRWTAEHTSDIASSLAISLLASRIANTSL